MKILLIWRDCYYKFLDIPSGWKSKDIESVKGREDAFWVICEHREVVEHILPVVLDLDHKELICKQARKGFKHSFLVSRSGVIQYYPYLGLYQGTLFEPLNVPPFENLSQLRTIGLAKYSGL